jgi:hypothetical protein
MTSIFSSMFGPSAAVTASRIETMRAAEMALISFSHRFKFHDDAGNGNGGMNTISGSISGSGSGSDIISDEHDHDHDIQLFDTPIPRSVVPLKKGSKYNCQLFSCTKGASSSSSSSVISSVLSSAAVDANANANAKNTNTMNTNTNTNDTEDSTSTLDTTQHDQLIIHGVQVTKKLSSHAHIDAHAEAHAEAHTEAPLVLLHGYMNGGLYFYRNLIGLANHCKTVYSLDMLGEFSEVKWSSVQ